jgi:hypothetical protein
MIPKQYTLSDIQALRERQQTAHRGRSIYSDMRSISEDQFRNALERDALPIIEQLLGVIEKQHEALGQFREHVIRHAKVWEDGGGSHHHPIWPKVAETLELGDPFIEKDKHQQRLRREEGEKRER